MGIKLDTLSDRQKKIPDEFKIPELLDEDKVYLPSDDPSAGQMAGALATEIVIADGGSYNVISNGNELFDPVNINQGEEQYESVLVTISGTCDGPPNEYGEWTLSGNMVDDLMYSFTPFTGQEYTITGPLSYSFGNFRVLPRDANDILDN